MAKILGGVMLVLGLILGAGANHELLAALGVVLLLIGFVIAGFARAGVA